MKVTTSDGKGGSRSTFHDFSIAECRKSGGRWVYQLHDAKGLLYDRGEWFSESLLESR